ncbi:MAG: hypothetical protein HN457_03835, partial [Opitutales bacterium]|nr:hypothetical protein [Opitutales bacterium]
MHKQSMTPRERIFNTLNRQAVDRIPIDIWHTPEVLESLKSYTGKNDELELYNKLGIDKIVWLLPQYQKAISDPNEDEGHDTWGVPTRKVRSGQATYHEFGKGPLADYEEPEELDDYPLWPDPDKFDYAAVKEAAEPARQFGFPTLGPWISHFEIYCHMRGMENALMDTIAEPEFLDAALDRIENIQTAILERYLREFGDQLDFVFIADDMGTQESQLISIPAYERHLKPRLKRWCDLSHAHGKKVLFHSDGAARNFVPHLIEAGIDILNPIQHLCPGMERAELKRDFGNQVIFHGGIENQHALPFGSVDD